MSRKGLAQVKVSQAVSESFKRVLSERKSRRWLWIVVVAFVALQIYFVQEMLAALMLFTGVFIVFAIFALLLYLIDRAGQWGLGWAGSQARRGLTAAEEISKKHHRRPRSEPAQ
ncbi:MAG: hypothetical protein ABSA96_03150 [Candidatus Acidiferrales bacterium]|jgi:Mn2+/Fe2+ NRAMP family transporter